MIVRLFLSACVRMSVCEGLYVLVCVLVTVCVWLWCVGLHGISFVVVYLCVST